MTNLDVLNVNSGYGKAEILHDISIRLADDEIITIIGPNGSGKSTLLKTIMGYCIPTSGKIMLQKREITKLKPHQKVAMGISYVPQLNNVFSSLSVEQNLNMGGYLLDNRQLQERKDKILTLFPVLRERRGKKAGTLSGGMRQLLAIGRAIISEPTIVLLDEPSAGLAPIVTNDIFQQIQEIKRGGRGIILVEQNAVHALRISNRAYVFAMGKLQFEDSASQILDNEKIRVAYLGD